jgi:hypothetical protein
MFAHLRFRSGEVFSINGKRYICSKPSGVLQPQPEIEEARFNTSLTDLGQLPEKPVAVEAPLPEVEQVQVEDVIDEPAMEPEVVDVEELVEEPVDEEGVSDADY